jgi:hypothetical protein
MKNNIVTIVAVIAIFLLSFDKATSLLTKRSKQQVILHGKNINILTNQINQMYSSGYRVMSIVGQPIATVATGDNRSYVYKEQHQNEFGEVIVIMEK